jgi:ArsR family metal-binding transcriptional regulator
MTSRRLLKKKINSVMNDIIEECYSMQMYSNGKIDMETNKIIDEAVNVFDDLLNRTNQARSIGDRKEMKKYFDLINSDLDKKSLALMAKMNKV